MVSTLPCPTLPFLLVSVTDLPLGSLLCPSPRDIEPPGTFSFCAWCLAYSFFPAGSLVPLLLRQNRVSHWAMGGLLTGSAGIILLLSWLMFPYFPWLFTYGMGSFPIGCTSAEVFCFVVFRPVHSSLVSTHGTRHLGVWQGQRVLAQGMQGGLQVEVFPVLEQFAYRSLYLKQC